MLFCLVAFCQKKDDYKKGKVYSGVTRHPDNMKTKALGSVPVFRRMICTFGGCEDMNDESVKKFHFYELPSFGGPSKSIPTPNGTFLIGSYLFQGCYGPARHSVEAGKYPTYCFVFDFPEECFPDKGTCEDFRNELEAFFCGQKEFERKFSKATSMYPPDDENMFPGEGLMERSTMGGRHKRQKMDDDFLRGTLDAVTREAHLTLP